MYTDCIFDSNLETTYVSLKRMVDNALRTLRKQCEDTK
jgi:hypothetical protein